jgi:hypothetical protein
MTTSTIGSRWATQTPSTRIAVSASIAFAVMLVLYLVLTTSPTFVGMHAALYRIWETQDKAWETITKAVLGFCIGMQLLIAYACAKAGSKVDADGNPCLASDEFPGWGLFILWLFGVPLAFANFAPDFFTAKGPDSWNIVGMMAICQFAGMLAILMPFIECKDSTTANRVMWFAVGKWIPCLVYLLFSHTAVTITLAVGTFLLDCLLHPIGVPPKATAQAVDAPATDEASPTVELSKNG